jgi:hypothetical protein
MTNWIEREAMQQFQPDSAPDRGNSEEQPLVIEDLPVEAAQHQATTSRKNKWRRSFPSLIAAGILLLLAVVVGVRLLSPVPGARRRKGQRLCRPWSPHDIVYVTTHLSETASSIYALQASDGSTLWNYTTKGRDAPYL